MLFLRKRYMAERDVLGSRATACAAKTNPDHRESALEEISQQWMLSMFS